MLKSEEKIFSEKKFVLHKLPASEAVLLKFELISLFGPAIGSLTSLFKDTESEEMDYDALGGAIGTAFSEIDPKKAHSMLIKVCEHCIVDGKRQPFDHMFVDSPMTDIYKVFGWVLEVNFSDFFGGKGLLQVVENTMKKPSTSKNV